MLKLVDFTGYDKIEDNTVPNYDVYRLLKTKCKPQVYFWRPRYYSWWFYYYCELNNKWYAKADVLKVGDKLETVWYELDSEPYFSSSVMVIQDPVNNLTHTYCDNDPEPYETFPFLAICAYAFVCSPGDEAEILCPKQMYKDPRYLYDKHTGQTLSVDRIVSNERSSFFNPNTLEGYQDYKTVFESKGKLYVCYDEDGSCQLLE